MTWSLLSMVSIRLVCTRRWHCPCVFLLHGLSYLHTFCHISGITLLCFFQHWHELRPVLVEKHDALCFYISISSKLAHELQDSLRHSRGTITFVKLDKVGQTEIFKQTVNLSLCLCNRSTTILWHFIDTNPSWVDRHILGEDGVQFMYIEVKMSISDKLLTIFFLFFSQSPFKQFTLSRYIVRIYDDIFSRSEVKRHLVDLPFLNKSLPEYSAETISQCVLYLHCSNALSRKTKGSYIIAQYSFEGVEF